MKISLDRLLPAVEADDMLGFCVACGDEASPVEPDAKRYPCESCGERAVYGAEQILLMTVA